MRPPHRCSAQTHRRAPAHVRRLVLAGLIGALATPAVASAAELVPERACYLTQSPMKFSGSGFAAGAPLEVSGPGTTMLTGSADSGGGFIATLNAPSAAAAGLTVPGTVPFPVTALDTTVGTQATAVVKLTALAFATSQGVASPRKLRTWSFSGFIARPGKPIYGHFRYRGRTRANYRFGVPRGACGELTKRAPGIPARRISAGRWTVQVDQNRTYRPREPFSVTKTTTVFRVFR